VSTNQQRREAAKRKLEHQMEARAARAKRNRIIGAGVTIGVVLVIVGLVLFFVNRADQQAEAEAREKAQQAEEQKAAEKKQAEEQKKQLEQLKKAAAEQAKKVKIPTKRMDPVQRPKPLPNPSACKYAPSQEAPAKEVKAPKETKAPAKGTVDVTMRTTAGEIGLTLDRALAPCTVNSMVSLIQQGYYDGTSCHRLGIEGLQMLQCGDPTGQGNGGPGYTVPDENFKQLKYGRGLIAMANTGQPNSGGGQFFLVFGDAKLDPLYTVFGTISDTGLKTLDKVARKGIDAESLMQSQDGTGKPAREVKFTKVTANGD
jgi:peptidyl-prolyl cis-trans isomerase B (cyclophilin B)